MRYGSLIQMLQSDWLDYCTIHKCAAAYVIKRMATFLISLESFEETLRTNVYNQIPEKTKSRTFMMSDELLFTCSFCFPCVFFSGLT